MQDKEMEALKQLDPNTYNAPTGVVLVELNDGRIMPIVAGDREVRVEQIKVQEKSGEREAILFRDEEVIKKQFGPKPLEMQPQDIVQSDPQKEERKMPSSNIPDKDLSGGPGGPRVYSGRTVPSSNIPDKDLSGGPGGPGVYSGPSPTSGVRVGGRRRGKKTKPRMEQAPAVHHRAGSGGVVLMQNAHVAEDVTVTAVGATAVVQDVVCEGNIR